LFGFTGFGCRIESKALTPSRDSCWDSQKPLISVALRLNEAKSSSPTSLDKKDGQPDLVDLRRIVKHLEESANRVVESLKSSPSTTSSS
jgi:hypothetical protein